MIDLDEMKRDMDAGTPGPWAANPLGGCSTVLAPTMPPRNDLRSEVSYGYQDSNGFCVGYPFLDAKNETRMDFVCFGHDDARRIARVPDMEATIIALTELVAILEGEQARADAQAATIEALRAREKAADAVAVMLENCLEVLTKEDGRLCCDGRECGCCGATKHQEAEHYANEALAAYRATGGAA